MGLSRLELAEIDQVREFPERLAPVQVDDEGATVPQIGRGGLRARVSAEGMDVDLVNCHLKSKLLTFPRGRFQPSDEGERARFGAYALYRRTAEAVTLRGYANELLDGEGPDRAVILLGDLNDEPPAATTQILLGPPRSEVPGGNAAMRRPRAKLTAAADDLAAQWRTLLEEPDRYRLVTSTDLLAQIPHEEAPRGWREWLWVRYAT